MKNFLKKITAMAIAVSTVSAVIPASAAEFKTNEIVQSNSTQEKQSSSSAVYCGKPITPEIAVYDEEGNMLEKGIDYDLEYENNINIGTAYVIVTFKGNYEGSRRVPFEIVAREITEENIKISEISDVTYSSTASEPKPIVVYNDMTLAEGTDYSLTYENNVDAGEASVIINFKGNYSGTVTKNFNIRSKELSADDISVSEIIQQEYTGGLICPEPTVNYGDITLVKDMDYTLTYESNDKIGTAKAVITLTGNYIGSKEVTFEITPIVIDTSKLVFSETAPQSFTGKEITPEPIITYNGVTLTKDKDYVLTYENNKDVGTATIKVEFILSCSGTAQTTFEIVPKEVNADNISVENIPTQYYTGKEITPEISIKNDDVLLTEGTDFDAEYKDNISVGTATAIITFKGNYIGTLEKEFEIKKKSSGGGGSSSGSGKPILSNPTPTPEATDIPDDKNDSTDTEETNIHRLYINGYDDNTFRPDNSITRAETAAMLLRINDSNTNVTADDMFTDVAEDTWYKDTVNQAAALGIVNGYEDGTFKPESEITRAEFTAMLTRLTGDNLTGELPFDDVAPSHWGYDSIYSAYSAGYMNGYDDNTFRPDIPITRAEAVKMINMAFDRTDYSNTENPFSDISSEHWAYQAILEAAVEHNVN